jgi:hypothetical protein
MRTIIVATAIGLLLLGQSGASAQSGQSCKDAATNATREATRRSNDETRNAEIACRGEQSCIKGALARQQPEIDNIKAQEAAALAQCMESTEQARMEAAAQNCLNSLPPAGSSQERVCQNINLIKEFRGAVDWVKYNLVRRSHLQEGKSFPSSPASLPKTTDTAPKKQQPTQNATDFKAGQTFGGHKHVSPGGATPTTTGPKTGQIFGGGYKHAPPPMVTTTPKQGRKFQGYNHLTPGAGTQTGTQDTKQ